MAAQPGLLLGCVAVLQLAVRPWHQVFKGPNAEVLSCWPCRWSAPWHVIGSLDGSWGGGRLPGSPSHMPAPADGRSELSRPASAAVSGAAQGTVTVH
jgi:hypothetical protein